MCHTQKLKIKYKSLNIIMFVVPSFNLITSYVGVLHINVLKIKEINYKITPLNTAKTSNMIF